MTKKIVLAFAFIAFFTTLYVNFLAAAGRLNDLSTGEISSFYSTLFTPAGFTFSIWGIIYLLNFGFLSIQFYKIIKRQVDLNKRLIIAYILICGFNMVWIYSWHYQLLFLSVIIMVGMLMALIYTVVITLKHRSKSKLNYVEFINFSVYLGWVSVATIANSSVWLYDLGAFKNNQTAMTVAIMLVAVVLAIWQNYRLKNYWYGLVIIWAFYGIYSARSTDFSNGANTVMIAALAGIALVMISSLYHVSRKLIQ